MRTHALQHDRCKKKDHLAAVLLNALIRKLKSLAFAAGIPLRQRHQLQAEAAIVYAEIIVQVIPNDGIGMDQSNLLRWTGRVVRVP
jgi:hypothetical protein